MTAADPNITHPNEKLKPKTTFVQIHRSFHEGYLRGDSNTQAVLLYLICKAQRFEKQTGGKLYKPGQVVASVALICEVTGLSRKAVFRCLNKLQEGQTIDTQRTCKGTYITLRNYLQYQLDHKHRGHAEGIADGMQQGYITRTKEVKNKKIKENISLAALTPYQGVLVQDWIQFTKKHSKTKIEPNPEAYAKAVLDLDRLAGVSEVKLRGVLDFLERDDFWRPNALSLPRLLDKSKTNGLRKVENILQAMERKTKEDFSGRHSIESLKEGYAEMLRKRNENRGI